MSYNLKFSLLCLISKLFFDVQIRLRSCQTQVSSHSHQYTTWGLLAGNDLCVARKVVVLLMELQELKDFGRQAGSFVAFCNIKKPHNGTGYIN